MSFIQFIKNIFRKEPNVIIRVPAADPVEALVRPIVAAQPKPKRKHSKKRVFGSVSATFKYKAKRMQVGQSKTFAVPNLPDMSANRYASIISSWCVNNWGKGAGVTRRVGDSIVLKRIA